jgi:hypothetical protein
MSLESKTGATSRGILSVFLLSSNDPKSRDPIRGHRKRLGLVWQDISPLGIRFLGRKRLQDMVRIKPSRLGAHGHRRYGLRIPCGKVRPIPGACRSVLGARNCQYTTAITSDRMKATGRVPRPSAIAIPPKNSSTPYQQSTPLIKLNRLTVASMALRGGVTDFLSLPLVRVRKQRPAARFLT